MVRAGDQTYLDLKFEGKHNSDIDVTGGIGLKAARGAEVSKLGIDEDDKYCIALFNDDELEFAIGRSGVNINLASRISNYRIDAFGKKEYDRKHKHQNT